MRHGARGGGAGRRPRGPGNRRGSAAARHPGDHQPRVPRGTRAGKGDRDLGRNRQPRAPRRTAARRRPDRRLRVARALLHQRANRGVSLLAALAVVGESADREGRSLDVRGVALGVLTLLATTFAFIEGGRSGLDSPAVILTAIAAILLLGAFIATEHMRRDRAMLPLNLFRRPAFSVANGAAGTMNLCTLGTLFVLTLFLQSVQGYSPLIAGLSIVPLFLPLAVIAPFAGRLTSRVGSRLPVAADLAVAAVGLALLVAAQAGSSYLVLLPAFMLWGVGLGILTPAVVAAAIAAVPGERSGLASAINNTARQAGRSGSQSRLRSQVSPAARASSAASTRLPLDPPACTWLRPCSPWRSFRAPASRASSSLGPGDEICKQIVDGRDEVAFHRPVRARNARPSDVRPGALAVASPT